MPRIQNPWPPLAAGIHAQKKNLTAGSRKYSNRSSLIVLAFSHQERKKECQFLWKGMNGLAPNSCPYHWMQNAFQKVQYSNCRWPRKSLEINALHIDEEMKKTT